MDRARRSELLGLPFDGVTMQSAVARCMEWCTGPRAPHTVITANAAILCTMRRDPELRKACLSGDLIVPDGMSVVWASRLARVPFPERVAGVDLMARLLREAASRGLSAYFLGARREVVSKLAARFDGGGHRRAAGASLEGSLADTQAKVLATAREFIA